MKIKNKDTGEILEISISDMSDYGLSPFQKGGTFGSSFNAARNQGKKEFIFNNKKYSTELKSELPIAKGSAILGDSKILKNLNKQPIIENTKSLGKVPIEELLIDKRTGKLATKEQAKFLNSVNKTPQNVHSLTKTIPRTTTENLKDIVSNPLTSFQQAVNKEPITGRGERNVYDNALDIINPTTYVKATKNTLKNITSPIETSKKLANTGLGILGNIVGDSYNQNIGEGAGVLFDATLASQGLKMGNTLLKNSLIASRDAKYGNSILKEGKDVRNSKEFFELHKGQPLEKKEINFLNKELEDRGILEIQRKHPLDPRPNLLRRGLVAEDYNVPKAVKDFIPNIIKGKKSVDNQYTMGNTRINAFEQYLGIPTKNTVYRVHSNSFKNGDDLVYTIPENKVDYNGLNLSSFSNEDLNHLKSIETYYKNPTKVNKELVRKSIRDTYSIPRLSRSVEVEDILKKDFSNFGKPIIQPDKTVFPAWDYLTGTGGGASFVKQGKNVTMKDVWDIQPFSRSRSLPKVIQNLDVKNILGAKNFNLNQSYQETPFGVIQTFQSGGSFQDKLRQQNKPITENINTLSQQPVIDQVKKQQALAKQSALYDRSFSKTPLETPASKARSIQLKNNYVANNPYSKLNDKGEIEAVSPERDLQGNPYNYTQAWRNDDGFKNMMHGVDAAMIATGIGELGVAGGKSLAKYATTQTPLKNAWKLNPYAFKPNPEMMYRGIGKEGAEDALRSGVFRAKQNVEPIMDATYGRFQLNKQFSNTYYTPKFNVADQYGQGFIAEVPKDAAKFNLRYPGGKVKKTWSQSTSENIPISKGKILEKNWLKGYKEVPQPKTNSKVIDFIGKEEVAPHTNGAYGYPKQVSGAGRDVYPNTPNKFLNQEYSSFGKMEKGVVNKADDFKSEIDWSKWNKEIPENKALMQEYNAIEQQAKANGSWMKNLDGSEFQGTPEQFVQQNSQNFKKAFGNSKLINPDGSVKTLYHGSKFENIKEFLSPKRNTKFKENTVTTKDNDYIYFSPDAKSAEWYVPKDKGKIYEVYANITNPEITNSYRYLANPTTDSKKLNINDAITNIDFNTMKSSIGASEIAIPFSNKVKSAIGNNGMFDMSNPNIYKALIPAVGIGAALQQKQFGGKINDNNGYLTSNLHNFTPKKIINSNHITTEGMAFPIEANGQVLYPNTGDYIFDTDKVIEKPLGIKKFQNGGRMMMASIADIANLKQKKVKFKYV